jgi:hypothetical protein
MDEIKKLEELVETVSKAVADGKLCFEEGNKAAGRRARVAMLQAGKDIKEIRKTILDKMKAK